MPKCVYMCMCVHTCSEDRSSGSVGHESFFLDSIPLLWPSLALTWLIVRNHGPYCPNRTDLAKEINQGFGISDCPTQKVIFSELMRHVQKRCSLFEKHHMKTRFLCELGSEHIRGFITLMICCSHWQECVEIPACYTPPRRNVFLHW